MSKLTVTLSVVDYLRNRPLTDAKCTADGLDLVVIPTKKISDLFASLAKDFEFDASEMSLSTYITKKIEGKPLIAIPVFPSRRLRHSFIFCNVNAGIREPKDLIGKKVGAPVYLQTAQVWVRGFLMHDYGVYPEKIKWFTERTERFGFRAPPDVSIQQIPPGRTLEDMLVKGEIDALSHPLIIEPYLQAVPQVKRLFDNPIEVEMEYFKRTGLNPIMHTVVMKKELYDRHPWVAVSLMKAFRRSKQLYLEDVEYDFKEFGWPWSSSYWVDRELPILGRDPFPYNFKDNKKTVETLVQYLYEQKLIPEKIEVEKLFAPNTLDI